MKKNLDEQLDNLLALHLRAHRLQPLAQINSHVPGERCEPDDFVRAKEAVNNFLAAKAEFLDRDDDFMIPDNRTCVFATERQHKESKRGKQVPTSYWSRWVIVAVTYRGVEYKYTAAGADLVQYYPGETGLTVEDPGFDAIGGEDAEHEICFRGIWYTAKCEGPPEAKRLANEAFKDVVRRMHAAKLTLNDVQRTWPKDREASWADIVIGLTPK